MNSNDQSSFYRLFLPILIALLGLSGTVRADDTCKMNVLSSGQEKDVKSTLAEVQALGEKAAASGNPCARTKPFSNDEITEGINALIPENDPKVKTTIAGIQVEDDKTLVDLMEKLLGGHNKAPDEYKKDFKIADDSCKKVICALKDKNVFGEKLGPRLLFMLGKYGFNGSHYAYRDSNKYGDKEIDDVLLAISDFPPTAFPVRNWNNSQLSHSKVKNEATHKDACGHTHQRGFRAPEITLFKEWSAEGDKDRRKIVRHELAHYLGMSYDLDESDTWLGFQEWERTKETYINGRYKYKTKYPDTVLKGNAKNPPTHPAEEFATAVEMYFEDSKNLKNYREDKYNYLKETVFDGLEYDKASSCDPESADSLEVQPQKLFQYYMKDSKNKENFETSHYKKCKDDVIMGFSQQSTLSLTQLKLAVTPCFEKEAARLVAEESYEKRKLLYPGNSLGILKERAMRNPVKLDDEMVNKLAKKAQAEVKETLIKEIKERAKYTPVPEKNETVETYCSSFALNVKLMIGDPFRGWDRLNSDHRSVYIPFAKQVCADLYSGASTVKTSMKDILKNNPEKIEAAVSAKFPE